MAFSVLIERSKLKRHSLRLGLISLALILIGFFSLDQTIAIFFKRSELETYYSFNREITNIGYSIHYFLLALVGFIVSKFFSHKIEYLRKNPSFNRALMQWSVFVFKCLVILGIIGAILKNMFGRQRPHLTVDFQNLNFVPFTSHHHWHSFPSGHTQVIFTMATILYLIFPKYAKWFFGGAFFLAFTRVVIHQHFFSDFIAGAFFGYIGTLWIYYRWPPKLK